MINKIIQYRDTGDWVDNRIIEAKTTGDDQVRISYFLSEEAYSERDCEYSFAAPFEFFEAIVDMFYKG